MSGANEPRIFLARGYWRVTPMPKPYAQHNKLWAPAHAFVAMLNSKLIEERYTAMTRRPALTNIVNYLTRQP